MIGKYEEQAYQSANTRRALDPDDVIAHFGLDYLTGSAVSIILRGGRDATNLRMVIEKLQKCLDIAEAERAAEHRRVESRIETLRAEIPRV